GARAHLSRILAAFALMVPLCVALVATAPGVAGASLGDTLRPALEARMKELRIPGAVVYVDQPGVGSWTGALGVSDLKTGAPMQPEMHFRIGSVTKTFTGTVILQLADEGKLKLDDPVAKYR